MGRILTAVLTALALLAGSGLEQRLYAGPPFPGGQPDSVKIKQLRSLGKNRVEVRLLDGTELQGRATVTDSGLVLTDSYWQNASQRSKKAYFARWQEIERIEIEREGPSYFWVFFAGIIFCGLVMILGPLVPHD